MSGDSVDCLYCHALVLAVLDCSSELLTYLDS